MPFPMLIKCYCIYKYNTKLSDIIVLNPVSISGVVVSICFVSYSQCCNKFYWIYENITKLADILAMSAVPIPCIVCCLLFSYVAPNIVISATEYIRISLN